MIVSNLFECELWIVSTRISRGCREILFCKLDIKHLGLGYRCGQSAGTEQAEIFTSLDMTIGRSSKLLNLITDKFAKRPGQLLESLVDTICIGEIQIRMSSMALAPDASAS